MVSSIFVDEINPSKVVFLERIPRSSGFQFLVHYEISGLWIYPPKKNGNGCCHVGMDPMFFDCCFCWWNIFFSRMCVGKLAQCLAKLLISNKQKD